MTPEAATEEPPALSLFDELIGQDRVVELLRASARSPVHAYLFVGPPGSGRRAAARAFAAALLCPEGGCGRCRHCQLARREAHPDLVVVERSGASVGVDEVRRLRTLAQRRPIEAARQVLVATDIHLALRSAPALLKTLEEPPAATVFVLLSEDLPPELSTVASRCVEVRFAPVGTDALEAWLRDRGTAPERAALIAAGASGDVARAGLLADDPSYQERVELWRNVPRRLDGTGSAVAELARAVLAAADAGLAPLRQRHHQEVDDLSERARLYGERGLPGRREIVERHNREERQWRTEEIRAGLAVLARAYRETLAAAPAAVSLSSGGSDYRHEARAVDLVTEAAASLVRNPNELLLMEALFLRLSEM